MKRAHPVVEHLARAALRSRGLAVPVHEVRIGTVTLLPHQSAAVAWLRPRLARHRGALLADPPGLGKTFVALALAAEHETTPLVIAPATLRHHWLDAAQRTGVTIHFLSTERLSAPAPVATPQPRFVIIDEAHHLRSAETRRHRRTQSLCHHATILLLSATPIHNHGRDLETLATLFHEPTTNRSIRSLARQLTLRRSLANTRPLIPAGSPAFVFPAIRHRSPMHVRAHKSPLADAILALPPIAHDTPDQHTLLQLGLLHALRSSAQALERRVRNRIAVTLAIEHSAEAEIEPTSAIRRAFAPLHDDVQLAMATLLTASSAECAPCDPGRAERFGELAQSARMQHDALRALLTRSSPDGDTDRARVLRRLARWSGRPVVAFTQFRATADAMFQALRHIPGVARLDSRSARIASGTITRQEAIGRLLEARYDAPRDRVRLLITTDVLSEGLSLTGVGIVVHLDLPWTPARLDQRIGRAARIGSEVPVVHSVHLPAPVHSAVYARIHAILARKRDDMTPITDTVHGDQAETECLLRMCSVRRGGARGWLTARVPGLAGSRIIAIAVLGTRRILVTLDRGALRAPRADDWTALAAATPVPRRRGGIARVRRALHTHLANCEISALLHPSALANRAPRRDLDGALRQAGASGRIAIALEHSALRRGGRAPMSGDGHWRGTTVRVLSGVELVP